MSVASPEEAARRRRQVLEIEPEYCAIGLAAIQRIRTERGWTTSACENESAAGERSRTPAAERNYRWLRLAQPFVVRPDEGT